MTSTNTYIIAGPIRKFENSDSSSSELDEIIPIEYAGNSSTSNALDSLNTSKKASLDS